MILVLCYSQLTNNAIYKNINAMYESINERILLAFLREKSLLLLLGKPTRSRE